ncbi:hypothetical protein, partial [Prevotella sp. P2-180]|uniref:hypothetical protein n=1 Tax=Prevotella sp. P2-180 TaxID=2024224 RepID=UPI000BDCF64A
KAWPAGPVPKKIKKLKIKKLKILKIKGFGLGKGLKAWPAGPVLANKLTPLKGLLVIIYATELRLFDAIELRVFDAIELRVFNAHSASVYAPWAPMRIDDE